MKLGIQTVEALPGTIPTLGKYCADDGSFHPLTLILAFFGGSVMGNDKPFRRLTLRQILSQSEKCARDLVELLRSDFMSKVADFRELIRPVRRRSHYPKIVSVQNALRKLLDTAKHTQELAEHLREHMETISDHANRERVSRM